MSLLDDMKAKADANGDGKLSMEDLADLKDKLPLDKLEQLQHIADSNDDGKINIDDLKNLDLGSIGSAIDDAKGLFGKIFK